LSFKRSLEEIEAWLSAEERAPLSEDEKAFIDHAAGQLGPAIDELDRTSRDRSNQPR